MDLARLARAVHLSAERRPDGTWLVSGGAAPHVVNPDAGICDCADFACRGGPCKHLARVQLALGDPGTVSALGAVVPMPKRARRKASPR